MYKLSLFFFFFFSLLFYCPPFLILICLILSSMCLSFFFFSCFSFHLFSSSSFSYTTIIHRYQFIINQVSVIIRVYVEWNKNTYVDAAFLSMRLVDVVFSSVCCERDKGNFCFSCGRFTMRIADVV
uniref:Uncharacterized protein n=1 Tax=Cacopsylla melanoneura TaxID=428564 RepID=A0A8D8WIA0_9HEMI